MTIADFQPFDVIAACSRAHKGDLMRFRVSLESLMRLEAHSIQVRKQFDMLSGKFKAKGLAAKAWCGSEEGEIHEWQVEVDDDGSVRYVGYADGELVVTTQYFSLFELQKQAQKELEKRSPLPDTAGATGWDNDFKWVGGCVLFFPGDDLDDSKAFEARVVELNDDVQAGILAARMRAQVALATKMSERVATSVVGTPTTFPAPTARRRRMGV
jgi:hypothetical protein